MIIKLCETSKELAQKAAVEAAACLNAAIERKGFARLVLSTGNSQLETIEQLVQQPVDWSKVEMFHLDEYVGMEETHPASFKKYLKEKFVAKVSLKAAHFVPNDPALLDALSEEILKAPVDLGLIGIGENAHLAFNDPPADFETKAPYIVVLLDEACKNQQVGEGWFPDLDAVPTRAISMSVFQIMRCEKIISCVPFAVKAEAVRKVLENEITNLVPATMLKAHSDVTLYVDRDSFAQADETKVNSAGCILQQ